jgi:hypothetical protein
VPIPPKKPTPPSIPALPDSPRQRLQTPTQRETASDVARREREARLAAIPPFVKEEITGNYEGDALLQARAARDPEERFAHIEGRVDAVVSTIGEMRVEVAENIGAMTGAVGALTGEVRGLATVVQNLSQRDHVTFTRTIEVDTAKKVAEVEVEAAKKVAAVEDGKDARKHRRERITKVVGIVAGLLSSGAVLHWLLGKL